MRLGPYRLESLILADDMKVGWIGRLRSTVAARHPPARPVNGSGDVYVALDDRGEKVALKLVYVDPSQPDDAAQNFIDDCTCVARTTDWRLPIERATRYGRLLSVEMNFVNDAQALSALIHAEGRIETTAAVARFVEIADALGASPIAHGRLRTSNILLNGWRKVVIVGWGEARLNGIEPDPAADARALATVLAGMVTGGRPRLDLVPPELQPVLGKALGAGGGYRDVPELVKAVEAEVPRPPPIQPGVPGDAPGGPPKGRWTPPVIAGLTLAGAAALLIGSAAVGIVPLNWTERPGPFTVDVGRYPLNIAMSARSGFIPNFGEGTVSVVDQDGARRTVPMQGHPADAVADPGRARLYVSNAADDTVAVVDTDQERVIDNISMGTGSSPRGIALGPNGEVYVANATSGPGSGAQPKGSVSVVGTGDGKVEDTVQVTGNPVEILTRPDDPHVYVVTHQPTTVVALDTAAEKMRVAGTVALDDAVSPDHAVMSTSGILYISDPASAAITVVDVTRPAERPSEILTAASVYGMALSGDGQLLYVAQQRPDQIAVIDTTHPESERMPTPLDAPPAALALTPDRGGLLVTLPGMTNRVTRLTLPTE